MELGTHANPELFLSGCIRQHAHLNMHLGVTLLVMSYDVIAFVLLDCLNKKYMTVQPTFSLGSIYLYHARAPSVFF